LILIFSRFEKDRRLRQLLQKHRVHPVGAAAGCDLLILIFSRFEKDRRLRQLLQKHRVHPVGTAAGRDLLILILGTRGHCRVVMNGQAK
jgi:hypothetical protein